VFSEAFAGALCVSRCLEVQVDFSCAVWRILNDSFQPNNKGDELLLCLDVGEGRTMLLPVCFASNSFKFFKLSEPLDIYQIALWRGNLSGPAISEWIHEELQE